MGKRITNDAENPSRKFSQLNHPEPEEDGTQLYNVHEVTRTAEGARQYKRVAENLTAEQVEAWVAEHGEWDD